MQLRNENWFGIKILAILWRGRRSHRSMYRIGKEIREGCVSDPFVRSIGASNALEQDEVLAQRKYLTALNDVALSVWEDEGGRAL